MKPSTTLVPNEGTDETTHFPEALLLSNEDLIEESEDDIFEAEEEMDEDIQEPENEETQTHHSIEHTTEGDPSQEH
ncbi:hypothetical protein Tco_1138375 [Tanacetum coccineum]